MQFQVTEVEFDFDELDAPTGDERDDIIADVVGHIWEADDEDDLVEEVTCASGWCIKSIDYRIILN